MRKGPIVVIGSINMDLVVRTPHIPSPGETVLGSEALAKVPGGKGANQAVAAARLGAEVWMVGRVGGDSFGAELLEGLRENTVCTDYVTATRGISSGCALIEVDDAGQNSIVVAPGANSRVSRRDIDRAKPLLRRAAFVLFQLELPLDTVAYGIEVCRRAGTPTMLDPAPVPPGGLPDSLFAVDVFSPNEGEAEAIFAAARGARKRPARNAGKAAPRKGKADKEAERRKLAEDAIKKGAGKVVLKLGAEGAWARGASGWELRTPAFPVKVADTTAAGDAFTAALAVALSEGMAVPEAVRFANAAGGICCETFGAQPALPLRQDVEILLKKKSARQ